jgi:hypothetical protein
MNSTGIRVLSQALVHPFDGTVFHDFLIEVAPSVREDIFVDGGLLYSGPAPAVANPSALLQFGNASTNENIRGEITELVFR